MKVELDFQPIRSSPFEYPVLVWNQKWGNGYGAICIGFRTREGWAVQGFVEPEDRLIVPSHWSYMVGPSCRREYLPIEGVGQA